MSQTDADGRDPMKTAGEFTVSFSSVTHSHAFDAVLDLDGDGFVVGIEVLGVLSKCAKLGAPRAEVVRRAGGISVAIDPGADAMYVRLKSGTSSHQVVRPTILEVAADHTLAGMRVQPQAR